MARPSLYNEERCQKIIDAVKNGMSRDDAARLAGVSPTALFDWMKQHPEFADRVHEADAYAVELAVTALRKAIAKGEWRAALSWLQAKRPLDWGQRQRVDVANAPGETLKTATLDLSQLSTSEIAALAEIIRKLDRPDDASES